MTHRPKHSGYSNKDKDHSPNTLDDNTFLLRKHKLIGAKNIYYQFFYIIFKSLLFFQVVYNNVYKTSVELLTIFKVAVFFIISTLTMAQRAVLSH